MILKPDEFTSAFSKKKVLVAEVPAITVPRQVDLTSVETMDTVESVQTGAIKAFITGNLVISVLLSLSLSQMIGALNAMQILVLTILFRLDIPVNMHDILGPVLKLSNFDVFQTDWLFEKMFGFGESENFDQIFHDSGFEGSNFIVGIGPIFVIVVLFLAWLPLQMVMKCMIKKCKVKPRCGMSYLVKHGDRRFQVTTFTMESILEIGISACITVIVVNRTSVREYNQTNWDWVAYILVVA